jgi:hypothetical protein
MVGALDQQLSQVAVAGFGDAKLLVAVTGVAASRPQTKITAVITTSLKALLVAQRENEGQRRQMAYTVDLDQRLGLLILVLGELLDGAVVFLDLHRHIRDLMEQRAKCLSQTRRQHGQATLRED